MSSSPSSILLIVFYVVILIFALSDLKQFIFHVHISRIDRVPVEVDIDSSLSSSLFYPISVGIIFNIFIVIFSIVNLYVLFWPRCLSCRLFFSTLILVFLFTIRFIVNIIMTKNRDGLSTPTLVERSFFAYSLSLEEELTTLTLDWFIKLIGFISTFLLCYQEKQLQTMSVERRRETQLMNNFE
jgi:hypothetical protein